MCKNSTKTRFMPGRSGKYFIFTNNLSIKKGHFVLLFILRCKEHGSLSTIKVRWTILKQTNVNGNLYKQVDGADTG